MPFEIYHPLMLATTKQQESATQVKAKSYAPSDTLCEKEITYNSLANETLLKATEGFHKEWREN